MHRNQHESMMKSQEEALELAKAAKENEEYDRREAEKKCQNKLRIKRDLEKQIEENYRKKVFK